MRTAFHSLAIAALCLVASPVFAQEAPLETKDKAVVQFDVNIEKITQSELGKKLDLAGKMQELPVSSDDVDPSAITRMFGAMSLPDNMEAFQNMRPGGEIPMEMFMRMVVNDKKAIDDSLDKMKDNAEEVSIGGKKFMKPTNGDAPEGVLFQRINDNTIEMGTEKYVTRGDATVATANLAKAWKMTPDHAIRIVVDVDGMEALKEEIIETAPPQAMAYAELLNNISNLRITIDLSGDNLLTLCATGKDEDMAEEFADGIDSLLMFAKMGMDPARAPNDEAANVMKAISEALEANLEGTEVSVKIPRPEGFDSVVEGMLPPGF